MAGEQESDSEGSSVENLGDVTQFGLTGALAQMANLTFMAGAPGKSTDLLLLQGRDADLYTVYRSYMGVVMQKG